MERVWSTKDSMMVKMIRFHKVSKQIIEKFG